MPEGLGSGWEDNAAPDHLLVAEHCMKKHLPIRDGAAGSAPSGGTTLPTIFAPTCARNLLVCIHALQKMTSEREPDMMVLLFVPMH